MRHSYLLPAALILLASTAPTLALSCKEEIETVGRRLDSAGAQKVTGKEPAGGATSSNSPNALDKPPSGQPSDPAMTPTARRVEEAKAMIETARGQEKAGDEKGCQATMTKVKETAGALP